MNLLWYVALGSAVGGASRYALSMFIQQRASSTFPIGTLIVNVTGSLVLGFVLRYALGSPSVSAEVRALLAHCGLEFEPACLEFHKTERAVRTASSEQVRQPIYKDATDEWRAYERFLEPLEAALGATLATYPEAPAT